MTSLITQLVKNLTAMLETQVLFLGWEDPLEKERQPTPVFLSGEFHGQRSLVLAYIVITFKTDWSI